MTSQILEMPDDEGATTVTTAPGGDGPEPEPDPPRRLGLAVGVVALGGLLFGFDTGVISGALLFLKTDFHLSAFQEGTVISSLLLGAAAGAFGSGRPADRWGRRRTLIVVAAAFTLGLAMATLAAGFWTMIAARVVLGLAVGSASTVVPLYLAEIAPPRLRGRLITVNQILLTTGILVSYLVNLWFADEADWRAMFGVGLVPSLLMLVGLFLVPESPVWLSGRGQERERKGAGPAGHRGRLADATVRRALLIGLTLGAVQQFAGINTIIYYAPSIMRRAGLPATNSIQYSVVIGVVNLLMTVAAVPLVDRAGRRPLLVLSLTGMASALVPLGFALDGGLGPASHVVALVCMGVYVSSFAIGLGPVFWILAAEVFPPSLRAWGAALCALVNWAANFLVGQLFLPAVDLVGEAVVFWFFAAVALAALWFVLRHVPETKNRPFAAIQEELMARTAATPARAAVAGAPPRAHSSSPSSVSLPE
ncbi:MFS transporter [Streptomyces sp. JHA26]|uniref:MFS transporter n=1 Tax=Streptomyces sp. JHA26 TaxID=1917143 RepID=UPI00209B7617|nr:MFS transporter [Streptomyces sp. JHA26]